MTNKLESLRTLFTAIGGSLPTSAPLHRGMFAIKKAASAEDELHVGLRDASGVMQWRQLLKIVGGTMSGALKIVGDLAPALQVSKVGGAASNHVLTIYSNLSTGNVFLPNATGFAMYSDAETTLKFRVAGDTGRINRLGGVTVTLAAGTGTPEAVVTAPVGSLFLRTDGGAVTTLYIKESGAGSTGWVAK